MNALINILYLIFIISCIFFGGKSITKILGLEQENKSLIPSIVISFGIGFSFMIIILIILGFFGWLKQPVLWVILFLFLIIGAINRNNLSYEIDSIRSIFKGLKKIEFFILILLSSISILYLITALSPTLDGDSLAGYLLLPREYAKNNSITVVDYAMGSIYPQNGQLISSLGFLLKGQILAQLLVTWTMGLLCILTIYSIGKFLFNKQTALVGVLIWYGTYSVAFLAQSAKIDLAWAAFDLMALYAFMQWYFSNSSKREMKWLLLAGVFIGIAGGIKQVSVFTIIILILGITFRLFKNKESNIYTFVKSYITFLIPVSIAGIWVIRSYLLTGTLAYSGGNLPNNQGILGFFQTLWQMSMLGNAVSLEGPMGKSIGPSILALVPIIFCFKKVDRRVWHILGYCGVMLVLWYNGVQRARHLLPTIALLSLIAGYAVNLLISLKPKIGYTVLMLVVFSIGLNIGPWVYVNFISMDRFGYIVGKHNLDEYLKVNLIKAHWYPNYKMTVKIRDELPDDVKIAALSTGNSYYVKRPFYCPGPAMLAPAWTQGSAEFPNPRNFYNELINFGITHVFINDYVVDQWNLENAWLNQPEFKGKYLEELISINGQHLYEIKEI